MKLEGMTIGEARNYWVHGERGGFMALPGEDAKKVITKEMLADPKFIVPFARHVAEAEGSRFRLSDKERQSAF
jgi:hypothetical protein